MSSNYLDAVRSVFSGSSQRQAARITTIQYAVVVDGIPDVYNEKYPILSMDTMNRIFENAKNHVEATEYIRSKNYLIANNAKQIASFYEINYAEISFELPFYKKHYSVGRNEPCPCGERKKNGERKKYKDCCLREK